MNARPLHAAIFLVAACNRSNVNGTAHESIVAPPMTVPTKSVELEPARRTLYLRARTGEHLERLELARAEGAAGLREGLADPELRSAAIEALGFAEGTEQLSLLCEIAKDSSKDSTKEDVERAVAAVANIAARGEGVDPEAAPGLACLRELAAKKSLLREAVAALDDAERQKRPIMRDGSL